ncbi:MAG: hypothetical protein HOH13_05765 [Crocinitomicaceae bacterium]|jgi:hypothetical protein|nr:hypothetical protein [Crocinitomicaceae bacterium]MBT5402210.1 hypothetical protein [Crocinitomicaceae bacterium]MBT6029792.1 hypothetical protein [Crocinitomicaceae bacterium]MBT6513655.1 hypothetical protein [Crocinitomicaceae bacterium]
MLKFFITFNLITLLTVQCNKEEVIIPGAFITHLSSDPLNDIFFLNDSKGIVCSGIEDNRERMYSLLLQKHKNHENNCSISKSKLEDNRF